VTYTGSLAPKQKNISGLARKQRESVEPALESESVSSAFLARELVDVSSRLGY
jgi:hypothetical protein